jgi:AcrR family transcriptional regulator
MEEGGADAVTHSAVAERSGVGRATLYRHWPRRQDLIGDIVQQEVAPPPAPWAGELHADLTTALTHVANALATTVEAARLITLADQAQRDGDARQLATIVRERHPLRAALELAQRNGQLAQDVSLEDAQALLLGPVLYQRLWATRPIEASFIDRVVGAFVSAHESPWAAMSQKGTET